MIDIIFNLQLIVLMIQYQNPIFNSYVLSLIYSLLSSSCLYLSCLSCSSCSSLSCLSCLFCLSCFRYFRSFSPFLRTVIFLFCSSSVLRFLSFGWSDGCVRLVLSHLMMQSPSIFYSISYPFLKITSFSQCFLFISTITYML